MSWTDRAVSIKIVILISISNSFMSLSSFLQEKEISDMERYALRVEHLFEASQVGGVLHLSITTTNDLFISHTNQPRKFPATARGQYPCTTARSLEKSAKRRSPIIWLYPPSKFNGVFNSTTSLATIVDWFVL